MHFDYINGDCIGSDAKITYNRMNVICTYNTSHPVRTLNKKAKHNKTQQRQKQNKIECKYNYKITIS